MTTNTYDYFFDWINNALCFEELDLIVSYVEEDASLTDKEAEYLIKKALEKKECM